WLSITSESYLLAGLLTSLGNYCTFGWVSLVNPTDLGLVINHMEELLYSWLSITSESYLLAESLTSLGNYCTFGWISLLNSTDLGLVINHMEELLYSRLSITSESYLLAGSLTSLGNYCTFGWISLLNPTDLGLKQCTIGLATLVHTIDSPFFVNNIETSLFGLDCLYFQQGDVQAYGINTSE
ncbi:hypothetical protein J6590_103670, partial [Homalodisca vitripennis]